MPQNRRKSLFTLTDRADGKMRVYSTGDPDRFILHLSDFDHYAKRQEWHEPETVTLKELQEEWNYWLSMNCADDDAIMDAVLTVAEYRQQLKSSHQTALPLAA